MSYTPVEHDNLVHAISQVMRLWDKDLDDLQMTLWTRTLKQWPWEEVRQALAELPQVCKSAPRPAHVVDILNERSEMRSPRYQALPDPEPSSCPPDVADAWRYWIPRFHDLTLPGELAAPEDVSTEQAADWLTLINRQVFLSDVSDVEKLAALPLAYRLDEIWSQS